MAIRRTKLTTKTRSVLPCVIESKRRGPHPLEAPLSHEVSTWYSQLPLTSAGGRIWWNRYVPSEKSFSEQISAILIGLGRNDIMSLVAGETLPYLQRTAAPTLSEFAAAGWEHWHVPTPGWSGSSPAMKIGNAFGLFGATVKSKIYLRMSDLPEAHAAWNKSIMWNYMPIRSGKHRIVHPGNPHVVDALEELFVHLKEAKRATDDIDAVMTQLRPRIFEECVRHAQDPKCPMKSSSEIMREFAEPAVRSFIATRYFRRAWRMTRTTPNESDYGDDRVAGSNAAWGILRRHVGRCLEETIKVRTALNSFGICFGQRQMGSLRAKPANSLSPMFNPSLRHKGRPVRVLPAGHSNYLEVELREFYEKVVAWARILCNKATPEQWDEALDFYIDNQWRFDSRMVARIARDEALEYFAKVRSGTAGGIVPVSDWCRDPSIYRGDVGQDYGHWRHSVSEYAEAWEPLGGLDGDIGPEAHGDLPLMTVPQGFMYSAGTETIIRADISMEVDAANEAGEEDA